MSVFKDYERLRYLHTTDLGHSNRPCNWDHNYLPSLAAWEQKWHL